MKATCPNPIVLPSGYIVPCGKCEICKSNRRNDWSIRIQLECKYQDKMPLMIGLDYAPAWLPVDINNSPKLLREDVSSFLKSYKRKYNLSNEKFKYFGCGEYGGLKGRPHYHLIFFGDDELYDLYCQDDAKARERLQPLWSFGRVWVGFAQWSGMHYVTKYVLKDDDSNFNPSVPSFTISSKGLGMAFLNSPDAFEITKRIQYMLYNKDYIIKNCPFWLPTDKESILCAIKYYKKFVPNWKVQLDSGKWVMIPRAIRKKLSASFSKPIDNPFYEFQRLEECLKMNEYLEQYNGTNQCDEIAQRTIDTIRKRLIKISHDKNLKKVSRL